MDSNRTSQYGQQQQQYPSEKGVGGGLSREPSYVQNNGGEGEYGQQQQNGEGYNNQSNLLSSEGRERQEQEAMDQHTQTLMPQPQGEQEYQGREQAHVLPHEQYAQQVGEQQHPHGLDYGQSMQTGEQITHSREMGEPVMQQQQQEQQQPYAGVGAVGYQPQGQQDLSHLQPSRSYSTYGQQGGQPITQQQQYPQENITAVGAAPLVEQNATTEQPELNRRDTVRTTRTAGPTTAVLPTNSKVAPSAIGPVQHVAGNGLGAALATSGHSITPTDKKALKAEIKNEAKFEKQLAQESKHENEEIGAQLKLTKASFKNAEKSAKYEAAYRKPYDKAIQREIKAKKFLLKVTNEYNKVAADLESATKEMEIRRNQHLADVQTREADQAKLESLRLQKGRNDMEREARHGDSLTKQAQAKRALSMSKRKSMI